MANKSNNTTKKTQTKAASKAGQKKPSTTAKKSTTQNKRATTNKKSTTSKKPTTSSATRKKAPASKKPTATDKRRALVMYELKMIGLFAVTLLMVLSLHTNSIGILGGMIKSFLFGMIGRTAYFFPYLLFGIIFIHLNKNFEIIRAKYTIVFSSVLLAITMLVSVLTNDQSNMILDQGNLKYYTIDGLSALYEAGNRLQSGGALGDLITKTVGSFIGNPGVFIVIVVLFLVSLLLGTSVSLTEIWDSRKKIKVPTMPKIFVEPQEGDKPVKVKKQKQVYEDPNPENRRVVKELKKLGSLKNNKILDFEAVEDTMLGPDDFDGAKAAGAKLMEKTNVEEEYIEVVEPKPQVSSFKKEPEIVFNDHMESATVVEVEPEKSVEVTEIPEEFKAEEKPKKIKESDIDTQTKIEVKEQIVSGTTKEVINYEVPSIELLNPVENTGNMTDRNEVIEKARVLEETLNSFNVDAKVVAINKGPTITMFELQPSPGVKVSKIVNLSDDIALSLAAHQVRIVAPIPGKSAVGIEVPNKETSMVVLREVLETGAFKEGKSKLDIGLGKDISGNAIVGDLGKMPHLLIAGATGSGKSVCVNTIISSILFNSTPDEVKFLMIDPKVVELSNYNGIPHLILPVVTDPKKASIALNWAVQEMTRRYQLFAEYSVRDVSSYNSKARKTQGSEEEMEILPKIVIIIDELADLMMVAPNAVEDAICRLAQMARAAGLHLIVATQRPSVDVITGVIKANIPSRIAFAVSSSTDSRTIIDMGGAEKLLGRGDMLYYPVGSSKPQRVQGAFISDSEVETLVEAVKAQGTEVVYKEEILDQPVNVGSDQGDEYLKEAIEFVVKNGSASVSMLQRKYRIGYNRAARIVDMMEERGIVGPSQGSKAREVLVSIEELAQAEAES